MWINQNGGLNVLWKSYAAFGGVFYGYFFFNCYNEIYKW